VLPCALSLLLLILLPLVLLGHAVMVLLGCGDLRLLLLLRGRKKLLHHSQVSCRSIRCMLALAPPPSRRRRKGRRGSRSTLYVLLCLMVVLLLLLVVVPSE